MARVRAYLGFAAAHPRTYEAMFSLHGLATLQASGRLPPSQAQARLDLAHHMLAQQDSR